jgi:aspartyl-tRNA(Asn)/glutamyl-tRNA(Gln) amidotransferase subunit A
VCRIYERIERSELNAFITLNKENAVEKAREADKRKNEDGYRRKKLLGVPVAIKDSISTMGIQTTCASKILKEERRKGYIPRCGANII